MPFQISTPTSASAWRPDHYQFAPSDSVPDALVLQCSTVAGSIEGDAPSVKVAYVDDDDATIVAEGSPIPEGHPVLSEALIHTSKVSKLLRITSEQYRQAGTPAQLAQSAARAVTRRGDLAFITETAPVAPTVAPVAGLLSVANTVDGGEVSGSLDALVDLIAVLETNLARPTHIVLGPRGWSELRKLKTADTYNTSLLGAGTSDSAQLLLSLPVIVNNAIDDYAGLVIDQRAIVSAVGAVQVATSQDAYFESDSIGYRVTWRFGHTVPRPNRMGKFTVAATGGS